MFFSTAVKISNVKRFSTFVGTEPTNEDLICYIAQEEDTLLTFVDPDHQGTMLL
jgi:hypothetical protein